MQIDVPLFRQETGSGDCGLVSAQMVLAHYGVKRNLDDIRKKIKLYPIGDGTSGSFSPQWASIFLDEGFSVEIVCLHPKLFTKADMNMSQEDIKQRFIELQSTLMAESNQNALKHYIEFLEKGGSINLQIPRLEMLRSEIADKKPVIFNYTSNFINGKTPKMNFHAAVVTGIDDNFIYVNDPLPDKRGGKQKYTHEDFIYATYGSLAGDIDNCIYIKITKK